MEKGKNNRGLVTLLLLIILGLAGYIVYDKVLFKEEPKEVKENDSIQEQVEENNAILKNDVGQVLNSIYGTFVIDTDGNVYFKPNEKVNSAGFDAIFKKESSLGITKTYQIEIYEANPSEHGFEGYKLDLTNIVSGYEIYRGNGGFKYVLFIDKVGSVYQLNFAIDTENGEIDYSNVEKLTDYNNIVSIVETHTFEGYRAVLIDRNNKQYRY